MTQTGMNNGAKKAVQILEMLGCNSPKDMSIEEIAWALGLTVTRKDMDGCEGRILMNDAEAIITVNNAVAYQPKINFIIAHEIGHATLHRNMKLFTDTERTLADWYANGAQEAEANEFATELLMPSTSFINQVKRKKLSLNLIEETAAFFGASKTATFLRYKDLGEFPLMIIFIENGLIKWKSHSKDFRYKWLEYGSKVPPYSVAGDFFYNGIEESAPVKVEALEWFPENYSLQQSNERKFLWEQCFKVTDNGILTCLWSG